MFRLLLVLGIIGASLSAQGRVVVLGVDGLDHALMAGWLEGGELPALQRLAASGSFRKLAPTNPAQSPTSWATLVTGRNPGETGIFGFLYRDVQGGSVVPRVALVGKGERTVLSSGVRALIWVAVFLVGLLVVWFLRPRWRHDGPLLGDQARRWRRRLRIAVLVSVGVTALLLMSARWMLASIPDSITVPVNRRSGEAFWEALHAEGVPVTSLFAPCAFPAPSEAGHLLCGLGVPDLAGTWGTSVVWRAGGVPGGRRVTQMGGQEVLLAPTSPGSGRYEGLQLVGPRNPIDQSSLRIPCLVTVDSDGVWVRGDGIEVRLAEGRFSEFQEVVFPWGELGATVHGIVRFRLLQRDPPVIYQSPVQLDPARQVPFASVTSPMEYGGFLTEDGPFATLGWAEATSPYQDELVDDSTLLQQLAILAKRREALLMQAARGDDWRVLFTVLSTPDRIQHVFWRDMDPSHPGHDAEAAKRRGPQILESYRRIDRIVARLQEEVLRDGDTLLVVSDHGFAPFRYAVNVNRWLAEQGLFAARADGGRSLENHLDRAAAFDHVDWSRTQVYNLGLGRLWLNLKGREPEGIVRKEQRKELLERVRGLLLGWEHEGKRVVRSARLGVDLYSGSRMAEAPDLVIGFERGFRISWNSCLGGTDEPTVFENRSRWSGDHCSVDPGLVPGVVLSSRPLLDGAATVLDVYPTLRALLDLDPVKELEGKSLLQGR